MKCRGVFRFSFSSPKEAVEAKNSLGGSGPKNGRSKTKVSVEGPVLVVEITSTDSVALRAAANGCLRNMKIIEDVGKVKVNAND